MTLSLTVNVTNNTKSTLTFQSMQATHGTNPIANPTILPPGGTSVVTAFPEDTVLGPSPEGSFQWLIPGASGPVQIAYDLHDDPVSMSMSACPSGYSVPTCAINSSGAGKVAINQP